MAFSLEGSFFIRCYSSLAQMLLIIKKEPKWLLMSSSKVKFTYLQCIDYDAVQRDATLCHDTEFSICNALTKLWINVKITYSILDFEWHHVFHNNYTCNKWKSNKNIISCSFWRNQCLKKPGFFLYLPTNSILF